MAKRTKERTAAERAERRKHGRCYFCQLKTVRERSLCIKHLAKNREYYHARKRGVALETANAHD